MTGTNFALLLVHKASHPGQASWSGWSLLALLATGQATGPAMGLPSGRRTGHWTGHWTGHGTPLWPLGRPLDQPWDSHLAT